jgi:hypothetical protein
MVRALQAPHLKSLTIILFAFALAVAIPLTQAQQISITGPPPQLHLAVGTSGATVDTVTFTVPANSVGSGTSIAGSQTVLIQVASRRSGGAGGPTTVLLVADSSRPLMSGTNSIPMTEISWTSANGIIPSGSFNGTTTQQLFSFFAPNGTTSQEDTLTFFYVNTTVHPAGTYTTTVTYTAIAL